MEFTRNLQGIYFNGQYNNGYVVAVLHVVVMVVYPDWAVDEKQRELVDEARVFFAVEKLLSEDRTHVLSSQRILDKYVTIMRAKFFATVPFAGINTLINYSE